MWLVSVCHTAAARFLENLSLPLAKETGDLPMEEDPVGEFLARKQVMGAEMEDEEALEAEASDAGSEEPDSGSETVDAPEEAPATLVEKTFEQESVQEIPLASSGPVDSAAADVEYSPEDTVRADGVLEQQDVDAGQGAESAEERYDEEVDTEDGDTVDGPVSGVDAKEEAAVEAEAEAKAEAAAEDSPAQKAHDDTGGQGVDGIEGLLEVFKSEELIDNPLADLSRDMDDLSVYSLLEETKRIAQRVKGEE